VGTHSKRYRLIAHPRDAAKFALVLAAIAIPGFFVSMAADGQIARADMNQHLKTAISQAVPLIWIVGSLYLIKVVIERRAGNKKPFQP
jgi:hypothetical protein